jgi:hypothetical protein
MGIWRQIAEYLFIRKKDAHEPRNFNTRVMHGINRISILLFLIAIIVMVYRLIKS